MRDQVKAGVAARCRQVRWRILVEYQIPASCEGPLPDDLDATAKDYLDKAAA